MAETRPISSISIGPRFRKVHTNIDVLAKSIGEIGLLHAVVITPDGRLVAGERRIRACFKLGWSEVPVRVVDLEDVLRGEFAENTCREPFLPSELADIGAAVEELERERAKARQGTRTDLGQNLPDVGGKTRDHVARMLGTSGFHYEKIKFVVDAAKADPERFGKLAEEMDRTGKVDGPYQKVKGQLRNDELAKRPPVIPPGKFATIVCDPPWPIEKIRMEVNEDEPDFDYPRWGEEELEERFTDLMRFIDSKANDSAILWMWSTIRHRPFVEDMLKRFGWNCIEGIWRKTRGIGHFGPRPRIGSCPEPLLIRGKKLFRALRTSSLQP